SRRCRSRRSRPHLSGRPRDAGGGGQPSPPRRGCPRCPVARVRDRDGRLHDRRRAPESGVPPAGHGGTDRRAPRGRPVGRQHQGLDRQSRRDGRRRSGHLGKRGRRPRPGRHRPMTIQLHDTLTGEDRPLEPLEPGLVRIYSCGPTVYGPTHIGNFRSFLFGDVLVRHLRRRGLRVTWVMNITDIDDKIIKGAAAAGTTIQELTDRWLAVFRADADRVRMTRPDVQPRATEHIDAIVALIETLLERGHAYRTDDGSIFFRIASWPAYGRLARLDPDQMRIGERVESDEYAKDD